MWRKILNWFSVFSYFFVIISSCALFKLYPVEYILKKEKKIIHHWIIIRLECFRGFHQTNWIFYPMQKQLWLGLSGKLNSSKNQLHCLMILSAEDLLPMQEMKKYYLQYALLMLIQDLDHTMLSNHKKSYARYSYGC